MITAERYHDFSMGHRVVGHESKCADLHGHNYRAHFVVTSTQAEQLDQIGRVIDFSCIKEIACDWLEDNFDHKFVVWEEDPLLRVAQCVFATMPGIITVPFNPTAENIATYLIKVLNPLFLERGVKILSVRLDETRKCSATAYAGEGLAHTA